MQHAGDTYQCLVSGGANEVKFRHKINISVWNTPAFDGSSHSQVTATDTVTHSLTKLDGSIFRQQNVSSFDVTMDEAATMEILQSMKCFIADRSNLLLP